LTSPLSDGVAAITDMEIQFLKTKRRKKASGQLHALKHDPNPKGRASAKCVAVLPRDERESVCAEIMLNKRADAR
jgi:hypothetical protein